MRQLGIFDHICNHKYARGQHTQSGEQFKAEGKDANCRYFFRHRSLSKKWFRNIVAYLELLEI